MALAFVAADATSHCARFYGNAEDVEISGRLPRHDASGGVAEVTAVETEPDAAGQFLQIGLGEVGIGAAGAAGSALQAFVDATHEHVEIEARRLGMALHHLANRHRRGDTIDP